MAALWQIEGLPAQQRTATLYFYAGDVYSLSFSARLRYLLGPLGACRVASAVRKWIPWSGGISSCFHFPVFQADWNAAGCQCFVF